VLSCTSNQKIFLKKMVHQDAHGLVKLAILIWVTSLLVMPTKLPTYLLYLPSTYLCPTYILIYLPIYLLIYHLPTIYLPYTYHLPTYLFIYLFTYLLSTYLPIFIYLPTYYLPTYLFVIYISSYVDLKT
jgi:hypothetical protein